MKQFNCIDANKNGSIDNIEFAKYCKKFPLDVFIKENPAIAFKKIDSNNSGNITIDE